MMPCLNEVSLTANILSFSYMCHSQRFSHSGTMHIVKSGWLDCSPQFYTVKGKEREENWHDFLRQISFKEKCYENSD